MTDSRYIEMRKADGTVQRIRRYKYARYQVVLYNRRTDRYTPMAHYNDPDMCHDLAGRGESREHEDWLVIDETGEVLA